MVEIPASQAAAKTSAISPGFADVVHDAQAVFNDVMQAMARPGMIRNIKPAVVPPAPLTPCAGSVLLALADYDTTVWLDRDSSVTLEPLRWLRFHCGTKTTEDTEQATFALMANPASMPDLSYFTPGTALYPDRSTTVIVQVESLENGVGWTLEGPGIQGKSQLQVTGLSDDFSRQWKNNRARFPLGVDVILCAHDRLACLPRTVRIEEG